MLENLRCSVTYLILLSDKLSYILGANDMNILNHVTQSAAAQHIDILYSNAFIPLINRPIQQASHCFSQPFKLKSEICLYGIKSKYSIRTSWLMECLKLSINTKNKSHIASNIIKHDYRSKLNHVWIGVESKLHAELLDKHKSNLK